MNNGESIVNQHCGVFYFSPKITHFKKCNHNTFFYNALKFLPWLLYGYFANSCISVYCLLSQEWHYQILSLSINQNFEKQVNHRICGSYVGGFRVQENCSNATWLHSWVIKMSSNMKKAFFGRTTSLCLITMAFQFHVLMIQILQKTSGWIQTIIRSNNKKNPKVNELYTESGKAAKIT